MQDHRSPHWPAPIASPGTSAFDDQRLLILELLVDPPAGGDRFEALSATLGRSVPDLRRAAGALARAGLASVERDRVMASPAAVAFDALWPVAL
jgi:hypothetical protein